VVYVVMSAGLTFIREAAVLVRREGWLGALLNFDPQHRRRLVLRACQGLRRGRSHVVRATQYNPMLWTVSIDLAGSALVFLSGNSRRGSDVSEGS
jgi:hypothetical protein